MMMKNINGLLSIVIAFALMSCNAANSQKEGNIRITGNLENVSGKELILEQFVNNQPSSVDTAIVNEDGSFEIAHTFDYVDFYRLKSSAQNAAIFILSPGEEVEISGDGSKLGPDLSISGSENTTLLWSYYNEAATFGQKSQELRNQAQALGQEPTAEKQEIIDEFNSINSAFLVYSQEFIKNNSSSPAILSALGNLDIQNDLEYFIIARDGLKENFGESTFYASLNQQIEQAIVAKQKEKMFDPGNEVPNITQNDPSGQARSLYDLRGKVVLLDFWASWCRPCRAENPNVVRLYDKYKGDGFDVFSVSLDKTKDKWVQAIEADGLAWDNHVSDLQYWNSEAAKLYSVKSIPFTVLLDREGKVINIKLRGPALEAKLKEIFGY